MPQDQRSPRQMDYRTRPQMTW